MYKILFQDKSSNSILEAFISSHQVELTKTSLSLKLSFSSITSKLLAINIEITKSVTPVAEKIKRQTGETRSVD